MERALLLLERQADGALDTAEAAELAAALADPDRGARLRSERRMALLLGVALASGGGAAARRVRLAIDAAESRRLLRRPKARRQARQGWIWPLAVAALLLLGCGWWWLAAGDGLAIGGDLRAGDGRPHRVQLADGTRLRLDDGGLRRIATNRFALEGRLQVEAAPQPADAPLRFATPAAEALVLGTVFTLDADAATTRLQVERGSVALERAGQRLLVAAGGVATARTAAWPALVPVDAPAAVRTLRSFPLVGGRAPGFWHGRVADCPPGRSGPALHGVVYSQAYGHFGVAYDNWEHPETDTVRMAEGLRFRCWLWSDGDLPGFELRSGSSDSDADLGIPLDPPHRTWIRLDVPLALLSDDRGRRHAPGQRLADLRLFALARPGQSIVVAEPELVTPGTP